MTEYSWWEEVPADASLMQGDLVEACPVSVFKDDLAFEKDDNLDALLEVLRGGVGIQTVRAIVMTQACDLAERKIANVILCPAFKLDDFRQIWEEQYKKEKGKSPNDGTFMGHVKMIQQGRVWNLTLLRKREAGDGVTLTAPTTVVDFHEVFSLPFAFLEVWVRKGGQPRLRLGPPYREHLSQSFARFFMRVGLPVNITDV